MRNSDGTYKELTARHITRVGVKMFVNLNRSRKRDFQFLSVSLIFHVRSVMFSYIIVFCLFSLCLSRYVFISFVHPSVILLYVFLVMTLFLSRSCLYSEASLFSYLLVCLISIMSSVYICIIHVYICLSYVACFTLPNRMMYRFSQFCVISFLAISLLLFKYVVMHVI